MNVQRFAFSIVTLAAIALMSLTNSASAQFGGGCGCGGQHASYGGCGGGCADDLWAGWCNQGCDTGCGRKHHLFHKFGWGSGCCGTSDPMGWNLNAGCGGCGGCGSCGCETKACGGCFKHLHGLFKHHRRQSGCGESCCDSGCTGCNHCGRLGLFSGCFRLRCGNSGLFQSPRCDSGYTGCNADTCGCMGESFYGDTMIHGDAMHGDAIHGEGQMDHVQPVPMDNAPEGGLPQPTEDDPATAIRFRNLRGGSY